MLCHKKIQDHRRQSKVRVGTSDDAFAAQSSANPFGASNNDSAIGLTANPLSDS